eukprot:TRINITY_DN82036_c0_g1_i1.p1 TRINITY_DN82036_c0_g1~~TRINITY_DN82036_c0_g1_i1.p1  ORF type:complete len:147 (+),score=5.11 TRINITY_DN82036_c0_g1_i1:29-442(+)
MDVSGMVLIRVKNDHRRYERGGQGFGCKKFTFGVSMSAAFIVNKNCDQYFWTSDPVSPLTRTIFYDQFSSKLMQISSYLLKQFDRGTILRIKFIILSVEYSIQLENNLWQLWVDFFIKKSTRDGAGGGITSVYAIYV